MCGTDLFSFGAVLYEMVTGRLAFSGETPAIVMDAILNRVPITAGRVNPELSPKLEVIIEKAIEKDRKLRYSERDRYQERLNAGEEGRNSVECGTGGCGAIRIWKNGWGSRACKIKTNELDYVGWSDGAGLIGRGFLLVPSAARGDGEDRS
jgi:serine/threonine protein kinase